MLESFEPRTPLACNISLHIPFAIPATCLFRSLLYIYNSHTLFMFIIFSPTFLHSFPQLPLVPVFLCLLFIAQERFSVHRNIFSSWSHIIFFFFKQVHSNERDGRRCSNNKNIYTNITSCFLTYKIKELKTNNIDAISLMSSLLWSSSHLLINKTNISCQMVWLSHQIPTTNKKKILL